MATLCTWVYSVDIFDRPMSSAGITAKIKTSTNSGYFNIQGL